MDRRIDAATASAATLPALTRADLPRGKFLCGCALLVAVQLLLSLYHIRDVPLIDPDEARYAAAGRSMAEGGSWLIPEFNGQPRINKPPLFYWLVATSCKLGGVSDELTSRMPSMLMSLLLLSCTLWLAARIFSRQTALIAGAVLVSMPLYAVLSRICITDMTLAAFVFGTLACLLLVTTESFPARAGMWLAGILFGLAILTKATPALVVILIVIIDRVLALPSQERRFLRWAPWLLVAAVVFSSSAEWFYAAGDEIEKSASASARTVAAQTKMQRYEMIDAVFGGLSRVLAGAAIVMTALCAWRAGLGRLKNLPWRGALALALVVGVWWYAVLVYVLGWDRFNHLLEVEVGGRIAGDMHRQPMYYYLYTIMTVAFPWSIGLAGALGTAWPDGRTEEDSPRRAERFFIACVLGVLLFFSIPGAKLATYLLPAMPAVAILVARYIERWTVSRPQIARKWSISTWVLTACTCIALSVLMLNPGLIEGEHHVFVERFPLPLWAFSLVACAAFGAGWLLVMRGKGAGGTAILFSATVGTMLLALPPTLYNLEKRSSRELCDRVRERIGDVIRAGRLATVGAEIQSLTYYLHAPVYETRRRRLVRDEPVPGQPPVTADEPFSLIVEEELARPEKVVLFIPRRYYARMLGTNRKTLAAYSREKIMATLPENCSLVEIDDEMIVVRNLR